MVGFDAGDPLFDTAEETGGSKDAVVVSHTHTATSTDSGHTHPPLAPATAYAGGPNNGQALRGDAQQSTSMATTGIGTANITTTVDTAGASGTNANIQPYITVYMWKRTV
jgi:hypothetical protein